MPHRIPRATTRLASLGLTTLALALPGMPVDAQVQHAAGVDKSDKNVVLSADTVTKDDVNNTVSANGHVELVQGASMLLAEHVIWNQSTDIVIATGDVKLVDDVGNIYFGDYLEITDDMRQAFMRNVSGLLADNSRLVGQQADKDGDVMTINRGVYSSCELCKNDPTQPPTWQIKAVKVIHDSDNKRLYYHDATFELDGLPIAWTPYFSTYDPSVKRADGLLYSEIGYRSQLGIFSLSAYYFDIAPDMDLQLDGGYYSEQGPLLGGIFRERFDTGQIQLSGSLAESNIRQYPQNSPNPDDKTIRGHIFAEGEFDLSDNWRAGFNFARTEDDIYVLKYQYSSLQVLPSTAYVEGFFDRDYIIASVYSFQDLRANINSDQPHALPYVSYSFLGDPGDTLGGRWADSGSILDLQRLPGIIPGESVERFTNNASWSRKLIGDSGLVTVLNASAETDYYWTQNAQPDPITDQTTAKPSVGRVFPQAYAVLSYPLERPVGYANMIVEPIVSFVVAPAYANNKAIPNEDSNDIQIEESNILSGNRFPGVDRIEGGSRVTYGVRTGLYNLGTGYTNFFLGESYRISGDTLYPTDSGLVTRFSDIVGELEIAPGKLIDIDYRFQLANDLKSDHLQEINFKVGPDDYGFTGTYLFGGAIKTYLFGGAIKEPNFLAPETNEISLGTFYKFNAHWSISGTETAELTQPRTVLRYGISGGYADDCSSFTLLISHDQTRISGGTSGTAVLLTFSLKDLGIFKTPSVH